jgi:hypothetical protein
MFDNININNNIINKNSNNNNRVMPFGFSPFFSSWSSFFVLDAKSDELDWP